MASGVTVQQKVVEEYSALKANKYRYMIARVTPDLKEVTIEKVVPISNDNYDEFLKDLPEDDCRYAIYNFEYDFEGGHRSKIVFYQWAPETSKTKSKMIYASTKDSIKKALVGIQIEIQGTERPEVDKNVVLEKCKSVSK